VGPDQFGQRESGHSVDFDEEGFTFSDVGIDISSPPPAPRVGGDTEQDVERAESKLTNPSAKNSILYQGLSDTLNCRACKCGGDEYEEVVDKKKNQHYARAISSDSIGEYVLLEDDDEEKDAQAFVQEISTMKEHVSSLQGIVVALLITVAVLCLGLALVIYSELDAERQANAKTWALLASIPIVALLFTWFHIWLAIQMMFRPLSFIGIWQYRDTGVGIGWQGIVPRKAAKMARDSYKYAKPHLDGPRVWLARVDARTLVAQMRPQLQQIIAESLTKVSNRHFPTAVKVGFLSDKMRDKLAINAVDKIQESSPALWTEFTDLLCDERIGIDNAGMIVKVFTENKELLNRFS
jgi:hypothetical protein